MPARIIHMIYFPWGKDMKLLPDQHAFDHRPHENMRRYAPEFEVRLWTYDAAEAFVQAEYPDHWRLMQTLAHPTMMVDVLRWLVVYHFGGIYWQYDMNPLAPMDRMLPSSGREARVFTEFVNDDAFCRKMAEEPIRNGKLEEPLRLLNQCFSAIPRHRFIRSVLDLIVERAGSLVPKRDYDILYICANAAVSTAYDRYGKGDDSVELSGRDETRSLMKVEYKGTWRKEKRDEGGNLKPEEGESVVGRQSSVVCGISEVVDGTRKIWRAVKRLPGVQSTVYRTVKRHGYETAFGELREERPEVMRVPEELARKAGGLLLERKVRSVLNYPCRHFPGLVDVLPQDVRVVEGDMVRGNGKHLNLLYDCIPCVDLIMMRNFLDHVDAGDARLILERIRQAGVRHILMTDYPYLNANWNNVTGEWRPVNLARPPYDLGEPKDVIPDPDPDRRPDRQLALWRIAAGKEG